MSLHATFFLDLLFSSGLQIQVSVFFMKKSREIFEAVIGSFIFKKLHLLALYNFIIYIFSTFFYFLGAQKFDDIKLATYRAAAKLYFVQKSTNCKFFDHLLSLLSLLICRVVQSWADLGFLCLHVLALSYKRSFHSHCTQMGSSDFNNFNDFWSECQNVRILVLEIAQLIASSHSFKPEENTFNPSSWDWFISLTWYCISACIERTEWSSCFGLCILVFLYPFF